MKLNCPEFKEMVEGTHQLTITGCREYTADSGTPMLDVFLKDGEGRTMRQGFAQTEEGRRSFESFIRAILPPQQLRGFNYNDLVGKSFLGQVIEKGGYWRVARWLPLSATKPLRRKEPLVAREEEPTFDQDEELDSLF